MEPKENRQAIVKENYQQVLARIEKISRNAGRNPEEIRLVVVTKTQPVEVIQTLINAGVTDFGENYVEEAMPKIQFLSMNNELSWHMIGHVQSRKAQIVTENFQYLHSLDSFKLGERLNKFALLLNMKFPVWIEFNVSGEESKYGWNISSKFNWEKILPDIERIFTLENLSILGAMTVPPFSTNPESSRPYYERLKKFQEYLKNHLQLTGFQELSMGMSSDFEVAIQEGSTCLRIGQAILGSRSR